MEQIEALETAYAYAGRLVAGVPADRRGSATPCPSYDVEGVANHLVTVLEMFSGALEGEQRSMEEYTGDFLGDDWDAAFGRAAARNLAGWRRPGVLDGTLAMPFGEVPAAVGVYLNLGDALLHGWDVGVGSGQDAPLPDEPAAMMLEFMRGMLKPEMRSEGPDAAFGPEVPVAADAPITDRLVGFAGRDPAWVAAG
jgi:uncharacterized protein (TIGR03086 family)